MNQRYIDFVPAKKDAKEATKPTSTAFFVQKTVVKELKPVAKPVTPVAKVEPTEIKPVFKPTVRPAAPAPKPAATPVSALKPAPKPVAEEPLNPAAKTFVKSKDTFFGVIEDYEPLFVGAQVEKRPLSTPRQSATLAAEAKSKKVRSPLFGANKPAKAPAPEKEAPAAAKTPEFEPLKTPSTPFIKSAQVEKRPLSKNVYKKTAPAPVEEPSAPVTIIDKPEKDAHIGPIIAIVLTIILGAAVGTVAFLLLPKK